MTLSTVFESNKGLLYCMAYCVMMTLQTNIAKALMYTIRASYVTFIRCLSLAFTLPLVEWNAAAATCNTTDLLIYVACSIIGVIPYCTANLCFSLMGVGDSTAIEFGGSLILVGVIAHFILDEKLSISYFILLLVDFLGIVFVVKPSFVFGSLEKHVRYKEIGAIIAMTGAVFLALWPILVRTLVKRNTLFSFLVTALHGLAGMIAAGVWTTIESAWKIPETWLAGLTLVGYGVVGTLQFYIGIAAIGNEEAKNVAVALTLSVAFSYVLQLTMFQAEVDWVSVGGAVIVVFCVTCSAYWTYLEGKVNSL
ncbi:hypothetical protein HOLleu_04557 [Holothuria leucospilota]|uniref:Uncharacterized protein n=1 Tax=Holothuria leucospilota TaxID=206669 RepID=A0A9Q1CUL3_HOLLE|nr:hypothetical protein HOLleu_04557 [Holothuria leucospilota]